MQRAVSSHLLDGSFANTLTHRLDQQEECVRSMEAGANAAAQDGNLAPFHELLDKAKSTNIASEDLSPYLAVYQDLQTRLQAVREIVVATKEKHHSKLQQALDKAGAIPQLVSDSARNGMESAALKMMCEGATGVHKMLRDAVQSGSTVLSHLEAVAVVRARLESGVSAEDKAGLEDVITRGTALGMTREVEVARNALRAMDRIRIKCHLHTDIRILSVPRDTIFLDLKSKIEQTYGATTAFVMKYRDDVGDLITLASQEDLANALLTMDASVDTHSGTRRSTGPKLDVFLSLPTTSVRSSLDGILASILSLPLLSFPLFLILFPLPCSTSDCICSERKSKDRKNTSKQSTGSERATALRTTLRRPQSKHSTTSLCLSLSLLRLSSPLLRPLHRLSPAPSRSPPHLLRALSWNGRPPPPPLRPPH